VRREARSVVAHRIRVFLWRAVLGAGAGYALSRAMLAKLAPAMAQCHASYTRWAGDVRVGKCVSDVGVKITPAVGFHHESHDKYNWDSSGGGFPYGHLSNVASASVQAPVSFHHLNVDQMSLYARTAKPASSRARATAHAPPPPSPRALGRPLRLSAPWRSPPPFPHTPPVDPATARSFVGTTACSWPRHVARTASSTGTILRPSS
jgi:hypothetical protein